MKRVVLPGLLLLALLALVGCGTATTNGTDSTTSHGTTTSTATTGVPSGFEPLSFTAVSEHDFWLLGDAPCDGGRCTAILRTSDGGNSFTRIAAPPLQAVGAAGVTPTLRFADQTDGWAFMTGSGGAVYATHDGGGHWQPLQLGGSLVAFASGGGSAYAVTADCSRSGCTNFHFQRSPVSREAWTASAMPFTPDGPVLDLTAHGTNVWLLGTRANQASGPHDLLARSTDAGRTFNVGDGPCYAGLGGTIEPSSASVLWALCPTGMLASAFRSTDGGGSFTALPTGELANSARLAPASDTTALLVPNGAAAAPLLTTDAGTSRQAVQTPGGASYWAWVGFTDSHVGAALVQTRTANSAPDGTGQLWRTSDGGASWHDVRFR